MFECRRRDDMEEWRERIDNGRFWELVDSAEEDSFVCVCLGLLKS